MNGRSSACPLLRKFIEKGNILAVPRFRGARVHPTDAYARQKSSTRGIRNLVLNGRSGQFLVSYPGQAPHLKGRLEVHSESRYTVVVSAKACPMSYAVVNVS